MLTVGREGSHVLTVGRGGSRVPSTVGRVGSRVPSAAKGDTYMSSLETRCFPNFGRGPRPV